VSAEPQQIKSRIWSPVSIPLKREALAEAIAVAARLRRRLLDFPNHPYEGDAQADDDAQKQQCQIGGCEHTEHSQTLSEVNQCKQRTSGLRQGNGLGAERTEAAGSCRPSRSSTSIDPNGAINCRPGHNFTPSIHVPSDVSHRMRDRLRCAEIERPSSTAAPNSCLELKGAGLALR